MNYNWHYDNLIRTRKLLNREKYKGIYYEDHHIIMLSMGGDDTKDNRVLLTAKEHYIAHYLLWKIHRNNKSVYAFFRMCQDANKTNLRISARTYEEIRIECAKISSENLKSMWNDPKMRNKLSISNSIKNKGRIHTEQSRKNMSEAHKGIKQSQESIDKRRIKMIGRKRTDETKRKLGLNFKGKKHTDKSKEKMSQSAKNRKLSDETKKEMSIKMSIDKKKPRRCYKLTSPNNIEYVFVGCKSLFEFFKNNNLSKNLLKKWINKGKVEIKNKNAKNTENWQLVSYKIKN